LALYKCRVLDGVGSRHTLTRESGDLATLKAELRTENKILLKASVVKEKEPNALFATERGVKLSEVVFFLRQFAVMIQASVSISDALNILRDRHCTKAFQRVINRVYSDVQSGVLLSEAFARHKRVFPHFFVGMIAIGEASGNLGAVLESLADYYENDRKIRSKAASSMAYPVLLLIMVTAVFFFLTLFVVPQFEALISELGGEIPALTKAVMAVSTFIKNNILYIVAVIAAMALALVLFGRTKKGRAVFDRLKFNLPMIGRVWRNLITARFVMAFLLLLKSGMVVSEAMENLLKMLGSAVFEERFKYSIEEVKRGRMISAAIKNTRLFPSMLVGMISVGERSGNLEEVLRSAGAFYREQVEASVTKAISLLEPLIIILSGVVVGIVILAVLLPEISLMQSV